MGDGFQDLLDEFSPKVQQLARSLRARVRNLVPEARENVLAGYKSLGYGFGSGMRDQFVAIVPHREHVNLQFHRGVELSDPAALLQTEFMLGRPASLECRDLVGAGAWEVRRMVIMVGGT